MRMENVTTETLQSAIIPRRFGSTIESGRGLAKRAIGVEYVFMDT